MRSALLSFAFLGFVLLCGDGAAELVSKKGRIEGESFVNLRAGPDLSYPSRAILSRGQEVTVEKEESSWYLVSLTDGRRGYVHKTLVLLLASEERNTVSKNENAQMLSAEEEAGSRPGGEEKNELPAASPQNVKRESQGKPLPIIKVLEGKEGEILWWLGIALCIFIIGWICGGNYYLRRDRIRRTKLRF